MTKTRTLMAIGFALYVLSFFLVAVVEGVPARGYVCAYLVLRMAVDTSLTAKLLANDPFLYLAIVMTASTNLLFLPVATILIRSDHRRRLLRGIAKALFVLTLPFPWVILAYEGGYFREGYFLWVIGMLLVMFADAVDRRKVAKTTVSVSAAD